uniref:FERM domain-containing protein 8 n=1 Tax=Ditylenchus dipsaci TaxID=166011 RepID=A0A915CY78_9BILA
MALNKKLRAPFERKYAEMSTEQHSFIEKSEQKPLLCQHNNKTEQTSEGESPASSSIYRHQPLISNDVLLSKHLSDSAILSLPKEKSKMRNNIDMKSIPKLSQSRGVTLPIIKLNEFSASSSPRLIRSGFTRATFGPSSTLREGHSPPQTSSPVGYTLRHSNEHSFSHDLNRTTVSESFNVGSNGEDDVQIRIFFPNGKAVQFAVENGQQAPSSALLDLMADHLEIDSAVACDAFALWLISPLLEVQLKPHHVAFEVHEKWPAFLRKFTTAQEEEIALDEPLLVLKRNFQLTIEHESEYIEEYERLSEVLYLDAKDQYMSGRYLVDVDVALELAALQLAVDFGPYESSEETLELIHDNLGQLVPAQHSNTIKSFHLFGLSMIECKSGLEKAMMEEYKKCSANYVNNHQRRKKFLEILQKTPFYGAAFFTGTKERKHSLLSAIVRRLTGSSHSSNVVVGINHQYITVVDPSRHELLECQPIDTCAWARSPDPVDEEEIPVFVIQYPDTSSISSSSSSSSSKRNGSISSAHSPAKLSAKERINGPSEVDKEITIEETEKNQEDFPFVNRQIFSKQAVMMDALLNTLCSDLYARLSVVH